MFDKQEHRENCVMLNIVAYGDEPYYTIEYYDKRDNAYHHGFGSKDYKIVKAYQKEYFDKWNSDFSEELIADLEDKYWEANRQIALYDNELKDVKHGRWVNDTYCSICGRFPVDVSESISNRRLTKFFECCPHCGAKMDGGK